MNRLRKLFEKHSVRVKRIRASRAVFINADVQEIHVEFETEEGDRLVLQLMPRHAHALVSQVSVSYQAINPPLGQRGDYATWEGMQDN